MLRPKIKIEAVESTKKFAKIFVISLVTKTRMLIFSLVSTKKFQKKTEIASTKASFQIAQCKRNTSEIASKAQGE